MAAAEAAELSGTDRMLFSTIMRWPPVPPLEVPEAKFLDILKSPATGTGKSVAGRGAFEFMEATAKLVAAGKWPGREQCIHVLNCSADDVRILHGGGEGGRRRICIAQRQLRNSRRDSGEPVQGVVLHRGLLWCSSGTGTKPAAGKCSGGEGRWGGGGGMREGTSGGGVHVQQSCRRRFHISNSLADPSAPTDLDFLK
ncbi:hypothetical protein B0H13DRAFT_1856519 [Mycena leptocephala]|nr:hypothetical protein B0H13DRAFT_1856519 [Mycena leptocephala]